MSNKKYMNKTIVGITIIALVIGIGVGYLGANTLRPTVTQNTRGNFVAGANGGNFGSMRGAAGAAGGLLSGTVAKQDAGSLTLNTRDGSSHVVLITPATTVQKSVGGSLSDVVVGNTIIVTGSTNSDGSISASSIQLRPGLPPATVQ